VRREIPSNADRSAPPAIEVRLDGELFRRVSESSAALLISRRWAEWRGTGRRRYLALIAGTPISSLGNPLLRGGTRPSRADGGGKRDLGQLIGHPLTNREFREKR
jgi:hypothetical protein